MLLNFRMGDEDYELEIRPDRSERAERSGRPEGGDWIVRIGADEVPLRAVRARDGSWLVDTHQGRRRLWCAADGDERLVFCEGRVHRLRLPDPGHVDEEDAGSAGPNLKAEMPGKVVRALVEPGQEVAEGQPLIILESMKMETELLAPVAGTVAAVHAAAGQVVGQGDPLIDITPDGGS